MGFMLNSPCGCCNPAFDADFIVFTYQFTEAGGRDLDTKTNVTSPYVGPFLGYSFSASDAPYLFWSGDNTGYGVESCYIDLAAIRAGYTAATFADVQLQCGWYGSRASGQMTMDIRAYKGGTMSKVGYQFINTGGNLTAFLSFPRTVLTGPPLAHTNLGTAHYDFETMILSMLP